MKEPTHVPAYRHFAQNLQGRDFFVGDIHGQLDWLECLLLHVKFDFCVDRLFSVGDLIDRGEYSLSTLMLAREDWFFPALGNHESFLYAADEDASLRMNWYLNGGSWWEELSSQERALAKQTIDEEYSLTLGVATRQGEIGVLHAQYPFKAWPIQDSRVLGVARDEILWARDVITQRQEYQTKGVRWLVSGHTPVESITRLGNQFFIDTGSGHPAGRRFPRPKLSLCEFTATQLKIYAVDGHGVVEQQIPLGEVEAVSAK